MTYPRTPINANQAKAYAEYLTGLFGKKFVPIERSDKINGAINFTAVGEKELEDWSGWKIVS